MGLDEFHLGKRVSREEAKSNYWHDTTRSLNINSYKNEEELTKKPRKSKSRSRRTKRKWCLRSLEKLFEGVGNDPIGYTLLIT